MEHPISILLTVLGTGVGVKLLDILAAHLRKRGEETTAMTVRELDDSAAMRKEWYAEVIALREEMDSLRQESRNEVAAVRAELESYRSKYYDLKMESGAKIATLEAQVRILQTENEQLRKEVDRLNGVSEKH